MLKLLMDRTPVEILEQWIDNNTLEYDHGIIIDTFSRINFSKSTQYIIFHLGSHNYRVEHVYSQFRNGINYTGKYKLKRFIQNIAVPTPFNFDFITKIQLKTFSRAPTFEERISQDLIETLYKIPRKSWDTMRVATRFLDVHHNAAVSANHPNRKRDRGEFEPDGYVSEFGKRRSKPKNKCKNLLRDLKNLLKIF